MAFLYLYEIANFIVLYLLQVHYTTTYIHHAGNFSHAGNIYISSHMSER